MILSKLNPIAPLLIEFNQPFAKIAVIRKNKKKGDKNRKKKMKKIFRHAEYESARRD